MRRRSQEKELVDYSRLVSWGVPTPPNPEERRHFSARLCALLEQSSQDSSLLSSSFPSLANILQQAEADVHLLHCRGGLRG